MDTLVPTEKNPEYFHPKGSPSEDGFMEPLNTTCVSFRWWGHPNLVGGFNHLKNMLVKLEIIPK